MKTVMHLAAALSLIVSIGSGTTHTITTPGFTFTPDNLTISPGDTVIFAIASIHNAVEVSQATWNANDTTHLPGGFSLPLGGGTIVLTQTGTHYYVCQPHASGGMKGMIVVNAVAPGSITIETMIDRDGNLATTGDRLPRNWNLKLYEDSVGSGNVIDSVVSGTSLTTGNLPPGTYAAFESDSNGWSHVGVIVDGASQGETSTSQWPVVITAGDTHTVTFINFAPRTIMNSGFAFVPDSILVGVGDSVHFVLESMHNAREVGESTWLANDTISNGGFDTPFGGGDVILTQLGTHYYVCVPHGSIGMKGRIVVATAVKQNVNDGWNLISLPVTVSDGSVSGLFPTAVSDAFSYEGTYQTRTNLVNGTGYWLKFNGSQTVSTFGSPVAHDSIDVSTGWNIIGSITVPVSAASIGSNPPGIITSPMFGYNGSYFVADTVEPGSGYWVKANQDGLLTLDSGTVMSPFTTVDRANMLGKTNRLIVRDASGRAQTLYFMRAGGDVRGAQSIPELPPLPPAGSFDVRFSEDRLVYVLGENEGHSCAIQMSSAQYPVTVSWVISAGQRGFYLRVQGEAVALNGTGSIGLTAPDRSLSLGVKGSGTIPRGFALDPAFPNPFNPKTNFGFRIVDFGLVTLKIFDVLGREVATIVDDMLAPGEYTRTWDAGSFASGVYMIRFEASSPQDPRKSFLRVEKVVLQK